MYCLMAVSGYGVVLLDENSNIVWELEVSYPGERIYGLDYDFDRERILLGFKTRIEEYAWNKERMFKYEFADNNINIHSVFYKDQNTFILSCTLKDSIVFVTRDGWARTFWTADQLFERPYDLKDWTHINYARYVDGHYYVTFHNHPDPKSDLDGLVLVLDDLGRLVKKVENVVSKPHAAIPLSDNSMLVADTGNGRIDEFRLLNNSKPEFVWSYPIVDDKYDRLVPINVDEEQPGLVKYSKGPHYLELWGGTGFIFMVIPNLRLARAITFPGKDTMMEWKLPKEIYKNSKIGEDPRPFQAKLLGVVPHGGL